MVIAPEFSREALDVFAAKKNLRVLTVAAGDAHNDFEFKRVGGVFWFRHSITASARNPR